MLRHAPRSAPPHGADVRLLEQAVLQPCRCEVLADEPVVVARPHVKDASVLSAKLPGRLRAVQDLLLIARVAQADAELRMCSCAIALVSGVKLFASSSEPP